MNSPGTTIFTDEEMPIRRAHKQHAKTCVVPRHQLKIRLPYPEAIGSNTGIRHNVDPDSAADSLANWKSLALGSATGKEGTVRRLHGSTRSS